MSNDVVFGKTMENVRYHSDINLVATKAKRNYLVPERRYYTTKKISDNLLTIEMKRIQIIKNKPDYLGLSLLEISEIVMRFGMI